MQQKKFDLEDRLVEYACKMIGITEFLPDSREGNQLAEQLIRSGHAPAFTYVQSAASSKDFVNKMATVLKELKECRTSLKVVLKKEMLQPAKKSDAVVKETDELIAIIGKSLSTSKKNSALNTPA